MDDIKFRSSRNSDSGIDPHQIEIMDRDMVPILRAKTGAERLKIANDMYEAARKMLTHYLLTQHPDWDQDRVTREAARRMSHGAI